MTPLALITGSVIIIVFSWFFSIKHRRYHGIPRFFSFESVFVLALLNHKLWFFNPFSPHQILSWIFLVGSALAGIAGYATLSKKGRPGANIEETTLLVRSGIYRFIRHPLYLSLLLLGTGILLKQSGPVQIIAGIVNAIALFFTARIEEREMVEKFGKEYEDYMKDTKMFIPFVF